jgi:NAD(P)-dependent dehydrogenase (short-subunit alcohol dehydrogenase family)
VTSPTTLRIDSQLSGQTVIVLGGSAGIGLATARLARAQGADVILAARDAERLKQAAEDVGARHSAALDAGDPEALQAFFESLPGPVDHVMATAGGPPYGPVLSLTHEEARAAISDHALLAIEVARNAQGRMRPGGSLLFMGGTGARRISSRAGMLSVISSTMSSLIAVLALELPPLRVNLIAAGFVDTPLSTSLLGDGLQARREDLKSRLPIRRVVTPEDVAALAVHLMSNTALTGAVYDVDGGQQLIP